MHYRKNPVKGLEYLKAVLLPVALAFLFVIQNLYFNYWLKLYSKEYFVRMSLVVFALGLVLYGSALFFGKKVKYTYLFIISALISFIFCAQFLYFKYSQSFLQFSAVRYFWQAGSIAGTAKSMISPELLLFIGNFLLVLAVFYFIQKKKVHEFTIPVLGKIIILIAIILIVVLGFKYLLYAEKKQWGNTSRLYTDVYDVKTLVGKIGIVNFSFEDIFRFFSHTNYASPAEKKFLQTFAKNRTSPATGGKYFGAEKGKNIIIIQLESLEAAVINKTINGQEITPNLNKLTKEGLYFDNYYTQVGPGNTADAEFSTMDSLYPLPDDVVFIDYAKNNFTALPALLDKNGYKTYSMHGDVPTFWNRSNIYPELGYQKAYSLADYKVRRPVGEGPSDLSDEDLFSQSLPRLESFKQPFMATLITMSLHTPFILPVDLQTMNIPAQTNLTETQWEYMQAAHYTDMAIGEFIDGLKKDGLYYKSVIFIWGDHQSYQNIYSALSPENLNSDPQTAQLYKNLDVSVLPGADPNNNIISNLQNGQVPLIVLAPGLPTGIVNTPGSHLDIYPTITNLLGIPTPKTVLGQDLFNSKNPVVTHFDVISGGINTILTNNMSYQADESGEFQNGECLQVPAQKTLPISYCQGLYNQQYDTVKASNIIVRGNLLNYLLTR